MRLEYVRTALRGALETFGGDVPLRRALIHSLGAIDDRLGRERELPSRRSRRHMR